MTYGKGASLVGCQTSNGAIALVCEGATDTKVLASLVRSVFSEEGYSVQAVHPDKDSLGGNAGFGAVKRWCKKYSSTLRFWSPWQVLIVHLDADVATNVGVSVNGRSVLEITTDIRSTVHDWLGTSKFQSGIKVAIAVPSTAIECWLWCAHSEETPAIESDPHCCEKLHKAGHIEKSDSYIKCPQKYENLARRLLEKRDDVRKVCSELDLFLKTLESIKQAV